MRRVVAGTAIGNFTEWYDFGVFGFLATTIAKVFFPSGSGSAAGLLATFATLAAAFICAGLVLTFNVTNYMLTGYVPTYLQDIAGAGKTEALLMVVIVLAVLLAVVTGVAWLSDRIGRKPIMWTGCGLLLIASVPAFLLMRHGSGFAVMFFGVLLVGLMLLCFNSTEPSTLPTLFPTRIRYGALAIGFNISVSAFGGTTPLVTEALVATTGNDLMPAYYLMLAGAVGAATVAFLPEPAGKPLPGSAPAVASEQEADELAERFRGAGG